MTTYADLGQRDFVDRWMENPKAITELNSGMEVVSRKLQEIGGGTVLDVGCFNGYGYNWLAKHCPVVFEYIGIDMNELALAYARKHNPGVEYQKFDLYNLHRVNETCDVVLASRVLIHLENWALALAGIVSAAKYAVVLVVKLGDEDSEQYIDGVLHRRFKRETLHGAADYLKCRMEVLDLPCSPIVFHKSGAQT